MPEGEGVLAAIARLIAEKRWLILVSIGAFLVLIAAGKGVWGIKVEDVAGRCVLGGLGLLLVCGGVWDAMRPQVDDRRLGKDYGLKITSPGDNAHVPDEFEIQGTYDTRPPRDLAVRTFVCSASSGRYWPNGRPVIFDDAAKRWSSTIRPGGKAGELKFVGIALLGENAERICQYYDDVTGDIVKLRKMFDQSIGLTGIPKLPSDWKECHKVRITRA